MHWSNRSVWKSWKNIVHRQRNGYETVHNLNDLMSQINGLRHKLSCMYIIIMDSGCTHEEVSLVSLGVLDNISILLDEDNDLEEITHLFNFFSKF